MKLQFAETDSEAWNLALQCEEDPCQMKELYSICSQFLSLSMPDDGTQSKQMTCKLMSAAACLQEAKKVDEQTEKKSCLEECIDHITECRQLCARIREFSIGIHESRNKQTDVLLMLYEFEAKMYLNDTGVEKVLERAITMSGVEPKTFETLAAIALEPPSGNKNVCVRALKIAIRKHLQSTQPDINKCSQLFHSLIQLCLGNGSAQDIIGQQEAWGYFSEIFDLIDKTPKGKYPEMEIVWLMTKAWNCGINFYSCNKYTEAEKWCGMSLRWIKYLNTHKQSYDDHMNTVYAEILAKLEKETLQPTHDSSNV